MQLKQSALKNASISLQSGVIERLRVTPVSRLSLLMGTVLRRYRHVHSTGPLGHICRFLIWLSFPLGRPGRIIDSAFWPAAYSIPAKFGKPSWLCRC